MSFNQDDSKEIISAILAFDDTTKEQILKKTKGKQLVIKYNNKFRAYNANIKYSEKRIIISMSKKWEDISEEIKKGLFQLLILKVFRIKKKTKQIGLYYSFIKNLTKYSEGNENETPNKLLESFKRINKRFFHDLESMPKIKYGKQSFSVLGNYNYHTGTITISSIFMKIKEEDNFFLDFVMYHELLHKKLGFNSDSSRNIYHSKAFLKEEQKYDPEIERKLRLFISKRKKELEPLKKRIVL